MSDTFTADQDTYTATHEAGHAVIRMARGMPPFRLVTIDPANVDGCPPDAAGYVQVDPQPVRRDDYARSTGAGPATEHYLLAVRQGHADPESATVTALLAEHAATADEYDSPWAVEEFGPSEILDAAEILGERWALDVARDVAMFWAEIEAVAAALLDRRTLTYAEVAAIVPDLS